MRAAGHHTSYILEMQFGYLILKPTANQPCVKFYTILIGLLGQLNSQHEIINKLLKKWPRFDQLNGNKIDEYVFMLVEISNLQKWFQEVKLKILLAFK